jgi:3alpha(or 20beta)-hydroxysteroid dehydrogenase
MGRLDGKVALISGAARGQGESEARLFVSEGARVVLGDVLDEAGEKVAAELGDAALYQHLDVAREEDWQSIVSAATRHFGRLDVLVNNAGILHTESLEQTRVEDFMRVVHVNQLGVFLGMKTVVPAMRAAGGGSIINVSSNAGLEGISHMVSYVSTKWAVRGMTKTAALELAPAGIRVNSVHPGGVATPMILGDEATASSTGEVMSGTPMRRMAEPGEIASLVLFLASDESSYSTGSEFVADGGMTAGHVIQAIE